MGDIQPHHGFRTCGAAAPERAERSLLTRVSRPALDLLEARGGYRFAVICLCVMALAVGLVFQRSFKQVFALSSSLERFTQQTAPAGVAELERIVGGWAVAAKEPFSRAIALGELTALASRLSLEIQQLFEGDLAEDLLAAAAASRTAAEKELASLASATQETAPPDALLSLSVETPGPVLLHMLAAGKAVEALLDDLRGAQMILVEKEERRLMILTAWFWAFIIVSTVLGSVFLHLLRTEVAERLRRTDAETRANTLAYFDPVTGLPNRFQFFDRVSAIAVRRERFSVLLVDIDDFRKFNDRFGQVAGDIALKELAFRIRAVAEVAGGLAARLSADDFALMVPDDDPDDLESLGERVMNACREPIIQAGHFYTLDVSIGCIQANIFYQTSGQGVEQMMREADLSLEAARRKEIRRIQLFTPDVHRNIVDWKTMTERLPKAIERREIEVYFQPQLSLAERRVIGFEALVRWTCDGRFVVPTDLIVMAEQTGMIRDLDLCVLEMAVAQVAGWNRRHHTDFAVSSNLSTVHMTAPETVRAIKACLERHEFPAHDLTVEITENAELKNDARTLSAITDLREHGCRVSVDDFGTGYSSFSYLSGFSTDEVKIDRSFVAGIEGSGTARQVLKALIDLAHTLGRSVVVEGVETHAQEQALAALGPDVLQGYLYGKPIPAPEALADATFCLNRPSSVACHRAAS